MYYYEHWMVVCNANTATVSYNVTLRCYSELLFGWMPYQSRTTHD